MNYEKKYKEALSWIESIYPTMQGSDKEDAEHYFPELKESEDERIRKELITHCRNTRCVTEEGAERIAKWITWLEKQSEKELIDKACEWLYNRQVIDLEVPNIDKFVSDFRKEMKQ